VNQETEHGRRLPADRAFVVQLWATAEVAPGRLAGRVEHVVSGQEARFTSLEEVWAFMAQVLAAQEGDRFPGPHRLPSTVAGRLKMGRGGLRGALGRQPHKISRR